MALILSPGCTRSGRRYQPLPSLPEDPTYEQTRLQFPEFRNLEVQYRGITAHPAAYDINQITLAFSYQEQEYLLTLDCLERSTRIWRGPLVPAQVPDFLCEPRYRLFSQEEIPLNQIRDELLKEFLVAMSEHMCSHYQPSRSIWDQDNISCQRNCSLCQNWRAYNA